MYFAGYSYFIFLVSFASMTILDSVAIQKILPHRFPFLLVDKIIELEPRVSIVGIKQVTFNEPFFSGHFPGAPVMPAALKIAAEKGLDTGAIAGTGRDGQVGAILALREFEDRESKIPFFTGIEDCKFRRPVVPGDTLRLEVTTLRIESKVQKMRGVATVDGHVTAEATITSIIADRPKEQ